MRNRTTRRRCLPLLLLGVLAIGSTSASAQESAGFKFLEVKVLGPDGQPITDVEVEIAIDGMRFPMSVDDDGMVSLNVPATGSRLELKVKHEGYATVGAQWQKGDTIPNEFTIPLEKGVAIGGIVHDENGEPIEGVKIEGYDSIDDSQTGKGKLQPRLRGELATTDAEGKWRTYAASKTPMQLQLKFSHPDFVSDRGYGFRGGTWEELRSLDHVVVLEKGIDLRGTILEPGGKPVAGAMVASGIGRWASDRQETTTDQAGEFRLKNVSAGNNMLTVISDDWAPEMQVVSIRKGMQPVDVTLKPGNLLRVRVIDRDGQPVAGVKAYPHEWRGYNALDHNRFRELLSDAEGIWQWEAAPSDAVNLSFSKKGYLSARQRALAPADEPHEITLLPAVVVTGKVVDQATGLPVDKFRYVEGVWWEPRYDHYVLQAHNIQVGENGRFRFVMSSGCEKFMIRVEADGYRPHNSREIFPGEDAVTIDVELEKGSGPKGVVLAPDGRPVVAANLALATTSGQVHIRNGELSTDYTNLTKTTTGDDGHFELPFSDGVYAIACVHEAGWAVLEPEADESELKLTLQPWARVVGTVRRGQEPLADERVSLVFNNRYVPNRPRIYWSYDEQTNAEGDFTFDRVKAGSATVSRRVKYADAGHGGWRTANSHAVAVDVQPGKTVEIQLGGAGRRVAGKLTVSADYEGDVAWRMGVVTLTEQQHPPGAKGFFHQMGRALGQASAWQAKKSASPANTPLQRTYAAAIADDGGFQVDDVPADTYRLTVTLYATPDGAQRNWNPIGTLHESVTIAEADGKDDKSFDLGEHELKMTKPKPPQQATGALILSAPAE